MTDLGGTVTRLGDDVKLLGDRQKTFGSDVLRLELAMKGLIDLARRESEPLDVAVIVTHAAESDAVTSYLPAVLRRLLSPE